MGQLRSFGLERQVSVKSTQPSLDDGALQGLGYFNGDNGSINISMFEDDNEYLSTISRLSSSTGVLCLFPLRNAKDTT